MPRPLTARTVATQKLAVAAAESYATPAESFAYLDGWAAALRYATALADDYGVRT